MSVNTRSSIPQESRVEDNDENAAEDADDELSPFPSPPPFSSNHPDTTTTTTSTRTEKSKDIPTRLTTAKPTTTSSASSSPLTPSLLSASEQTTGLDIDSDDVRHQPAGITTTTSAVAFETEANVAAPTTTATTVVATMEELAVVATPGTTTVANTAKGLFTALFKNVVLHFFVPFVNGVMLGFGEIVANEVAFRYGWFGSRILLAEGGTASVGIVRQEGGKKKNKDR